MQSAVQSLFEYSARRVTDEDLRHCPSDPGYWDYVRAMTEIRDSLEIPKEKTFDVTETIGLSCWAGESELRDKSFLRFRRFTNAVGLGMEFRQAEKGYASGDIREIYHLAFMLIDDRDPADEVYARKLMDTFRDGRDLYATNLYDVVEDPEPENFAYEYIDDSWLHLALGLMFLAQQIGDMDASERAASDLVRLLREGEYPVEPDLGPVVCDMLDRLGPGREFPTLYRDWPSLFEQFENPTRDADTQTVIESLKILKI